MPSRDPRQGSAETAAKQRAATPEPGAPEAAPEAPGAVPGVVQRARTAPARLSPRDVLHLQRTIGNRAVGRLLSGRAVQRDITYNVPPTANHEAAVDGYIDALNTAVDRAYKYVLHVPALGKYQDLDGHTLHWAELWAEYQRSGSSALMAAGFGYAVESLATLVYLPPAPPGMDIELQGSRSGTRPDVILKRGSDDVAWLDITSLQSEGHIWQKAHWDRAVIHLAELGYPKMDVNHFNPTPGYDDKVDETEFRKRIFWANKLLEIRRGAWKALGTQFRARRGGDPVTRANTLPGEVMEKIRNYFGVVVDAPMAASVLWAMGVNPSTHYLDNSVSRSRGESFLLRHDPNLPVIEIPSDGVPRPVPLTTEYLAQLARLVVRDDFETVSLAEEEHGPRMGESSGSELVVHGSGEGSLALGQEPPLATYQLELSGIPRVSTGLLRAMDDYLRQNQLSMAIHLDFGTVQTSFFAMPGPDFAESFRAALANLSTLDFAPSRERREDARESGGGPRRAEWQLARRRRIQARLELIPFPSVRRQQQALPPPTFLALLAAPGEEMDPSTGV